MNFIKNFTTLFLLALAPLVTAHAENKVYINRDLIEVTDDGITLNVLDQNISLDKLLADENGIYIYSTDLFTNGYVQCDICNEYHPNDWDSCPVQNVQAQQQDELLQEVQDLYQDQLETGMLDEFVEQPTLSDSDSGSWLQQDLLDDDDFAQSDYDYIE